MNKIRLAKLEDVSQILEIFNSSPYLATYENDKYYNKDIEEYIQSSPNWMIVYKIDKKIVGVLLAEIFSNYAYLHILVVKEEFRGKGISKKLLDFFEEEMKKRNIKDLEGMTTVDNKIMQQLFKKYNYIPGKKFIFYSKKL